MSSRHRDQHPQAGCRCPDHTVRREQKRRWAAAERCRAPERARAEIALARQAAQR